MIKARPKAQKYLFILLSVATAVPCRAAHAHRARETNQRLDKRNTARKTQIGGPGPISPEQQQTPRSGSTVLRSVAPTPFPICFHSDQYAAPRR